MESDSRSSGRGEGTLEELMRERIRGMIEAIVDEELAAALGAARSQRVGVARTGYRHGKRARTLTTSLGATTITMPRARIEDAWKPLRDAVRDPPDGSTLDSVLVGLHDKKTGRHSEAIAGYKKFLRKNDFTVVLHPPSSLETCRLGGAGESGTRSRARWVAARCKAVFQERESHEK